MAPPIFDLPDVAILAANVATWAVGHAGAGYHAHRLGAERLAADGPVLRLRRFERDGRAYERHLRIRTWKDRLPEAGGLFAGGRSKRSLGIGEVGRVEALQRFARETRRAERAHWASLLVLPLFWLWNPPLGVGLMVLYGVAVNAPFIAVQRYNRARIERALTRRARPARVRGRGTAS